MRIGLLAVAVAAMAVLSACRAPARDSAGARSDSSRLSQPYPIQPFAAVDFSGRRVSLADWKNQIIVINAWATWCAPCRRELPLLSSLQAKYQDRVRMLGILQDNVSDDFARQFIAQAGLNFPVVRTTFDIESHLPAIVVIPMTFVIDKEGRLVSTFAGEADPAALEREITHADSRAGLGSQKSEVKSQK